MKGRPLPTGQVRISIFGLPALESYFNAADLLYTMANGQGKLSGHCLPIAYMQRHWVELFLKTAINLHASISDSTGSYTRTDMKRRAWRP